MRHHIGGALRSRSKSLDFSLPAGRPLPVNTKLTSEQRAVDPPRRRYAIKLKEMIQPWSSQIREMVLSPVLRNHSYELLLTTSSPFPHHFSTAAWRRPIPGHPPNIHFGGEIHAGKDNEVRPLIASAPIPQLTDLQVSWRIPIPSFQCLRSMTRSKDLFR